MRYPSIDILRMVAIFVMVFVHFGENLSGYYAFFAGLGAPLFAFLTGVSYHLWATGLEERGLPESEITKVSVRRGLFVFSVGIAFNVLVWLPSDTFNWDVLTLIGVGLVLLNLLRHQPLIVSFSIILMMLTLSPFLRMIVGYDQYWQNRYYDPAMTFSDTWIGFFVAGYFPLFPWLVLPIGGFITANLLFPGGFSRTTKPVALWKLLSTGGCFLLVSQSINALNHWYPTVQSVAIFGKWTMYPPTTVYLLGMLGANLILLSSMHYLIDRHPSRSGHPWLVVPKRFSQYSFTIYVFHHLVHVWPMWIYAEIKGLETTYYWSKALPLRVSLCLAVVFLVFTYFLLRALGDKRSIGVEACMRWLCDEQPHKKSSERARND
ncbi:MAG: heparan-alpha-glucosaminide N-acetyltransferase domain-containing protein [Zavarzinella sp.]